MPCMLLALGKCQNGAAEKHSVLTTLKQNNYSKAIFFMETVVSEVSEYHFEINMLTNSSSVVWKIAQMSLLLIICSIRK